MTSTANMEQHGDNKTTQSETNGIIQFISEVATSFHINSLIQYSVVL